MIPLAAGGGGKEMNDLIKNLLPKLNQDNWNNTSDDAASFKLDNNNLVFTTDSYVVSPIFFPGGNIGKLAFCGTVNDLAVMGAKPIGLSLSLIIEEGFDKLDKIIETIGELSKETGIPIVTGDTKVMPRGTIDKIVINTSGVGLAKEIYDQPLEDGDLILASGTIGDHGAALLAKRFDMQTNFESDSNPIHIELLSLKGLIKCAKDVTRGGLAAVLNEIAQKHSKQLIIDEETVPVKSEAKKLTEILGIDILNLACEGRFICIIKPEAFDFTLKTLKEYNVDAAVIGVVKEGVGVHIQTKFGKRLLPTPSGNIVPRIC